MPLSSLPKSYKKFLSLIIAVIITYVSLRYDSTYTEYLGTLGSWETYKSWGFPFQYVFDNEVSSPVMGMSFDDTIKIFPLLANIYIYFLIVYYSVFKKS